MLKQDEPTMLKFTHEIKKDYNRFEIDVKTYINSNVLTPTNSWPTSILKQTSVLFQTRFEYLFV